MDWSREKLGELFACASKETLEELKNNFTDIKMDIKTDLDAATDQDEKKKLTELDGLVGEALEVIDEVQKEQSDESDDDEGSDTK